ncbi:MAG: fumarylacetoacetate hydrolase family protein [Gaiellaceae bacterium]
MRAGRVSDGRSELTAVQRGEQWFAVERSDGARSVTALDLLLRDGAPVPVSSLPLTEEYKPAVPCRPPRNVMCLGKNFRAHAEEFAAYSADSEAVPVHPIVFTKAPDSLCGAEDEIAVRRELGSALDYEVELGVVIGRDGAVIEVEAAAAHIAGYTVVNDITARDAQERHKQWFLAKSLPRATPIGPVVVTPDELGDLAELQISSHVNGEFRQGARLGEMIFNVEETIAIVSAIVPLRRGDIISMGTPSGVGIGFTPPRFLQDGDEVECAIEGIGRLRNVVRLVDSRPAAKVPAHAEGADRW